MAQSNDNGKRDMWIVALFSLGVILVLIEFGQLPVKVDKRQRKPRNGTKPLHPKLVANSIHVTPHHDADEIGSHGPERRKLWVSELHAPGNFDVEKAIPQGNSLMPGTGDFRLNIDYRFNETATEGLGLKRISIWHQIPLEVGEQENHHFNFICETPKGARAMMEINKWEKFNPIDQPVDKYGKVKYYKYKPKESVVAALGALPQTWGDPTEKHPDTGLMGDNDPMDALLIGDTHCTLGRIYTIRIVGAFVMVEHGDSDWKVIVVLQNDERMKNVKDISDVPEQTISELKDRFKWYKTWEGECVVEKTGMPSATVFEKPACEAQPGHRWNGGPEGKFGLGGTVMGKDYAVKVVHDSHRQWDKLVHGARLKYKARDPYEL